MSTVLKISRGTRSVLFQNESNTFQQYQLPSEQVEKLLGDKSHVYVKASISKTKGISILGAVKNQGW